MTYLIGTDEAGYGPNLGPLVVSATAWRVDGADGFVDLYDRLDGVVHAGSPAGGAKETLIPIADSKRLYKPRGTLAVLEAGLLSVLAAAGVTPGRWRDYWDRMDAASGPQRDELPWYRDYDRPLPVDAPPERIERLAGRLRDGLDRAGVAVESVRSSALFPARFNRLCERHGSKGTVLTQTTLRLVARSIEHLPAGPIFVLCDKHGGRSKYAPALQETFPDVLVEIRGEGRAESVYRLGPSDRRIEFRFRARGESFLPAALASMASKYARELAMGAFNEFWRREVPDLKPTAGYPVDAKRFRQEIRQAQERLGIEDHLLWRNR